MRKVEQEMLSAVEGRTSMSNGSTMVSYTPNEDGFEIDPLKEARSEIFLHGNLIATYWHNTSELDVNMKVYEKWPTNTTKSRLRALGADIDKLNKELKKSNSAGNAPGM